MKIRAVILFLLCSLFFISASYSAEVLRDMNGGQIKLSDLKNKWIILNYWADWCDICLEEVPELNLFYQHNRDKNVVIYGVNYDQLPIEELRRSAAQMRIAFPVLVDDPSRVWPLGEISALPVTFVIAPGGVVVKKILGANTQLSLTNTLQALQANR